MKSKRRLDPSVWSSVRTLIFILGGAIAAGWLVTAGCGCSVTPQCEFVEAVAASDAVILPEYVRYLEADSTLDAGERASIMEHVSQRRKLIEQEVDACK